MWTPATEGETVSLEVEVPPGQAGTFEIRTVLELVGGIATNDAPFCLIDASCVNDLVWSGGLDARRAIAELQYVKNGSGYVCSGALLNDRANSGTPYLLTANHCFSANESASSLEAYWDYRTVICNGSAPPLSSLKRSVGAQLLATSATNDFTFVKLSSIPSNRTLLGWAGLPSAGTLLYRISYPFPDTDYQPRPASFSTTTLDMTTATCSAIPRPYFLYSDEVTGGIYGGSSGSPVMTSNGQVIGQLNGTCGPNPAAGCDIRNRNVDGSFVYTYDAIKQWIDGSAAIPTTCTPSTTNVCLVGNRFQVSMTFNGAQMQANQFTPTSGLFSQKSDPNNIEVLLKMIDACSFNAKFWVYSGGTTDQAINITVVDTKTGTTKTYSNPASTKFQTITDSSAFSCP